MAIASALVIFVYKSSVERSILKLNSELDEGYTTELPQNVTPARFPLMSFVALLVGLFFFLSSGSLGATLSQYAGVNFSDIRPSFSATTHVMRATLSHDPILGIGAGRFGDVWAMYHPLQINQTIFWNSSFETGFSMLESTLATNGILPTLALLAVLILSLIHGFKLFSTKFPDRFSRFIAVASLVMLVSFVILFAVASPGLVLIVYGFIYLGLLVGVSTLTGRTQLRSLQYLRDPRVSFFAILVVVVATMASFTAVYFSANRFVSIIYYNRALAATDPVIAQQRIDKALSLSQNDIYWRSRTSLFVSQFTTLSATENPDKTQMQNYFTQAEQSARSAVAWANGNAVNWLTLSQVYQLVAGSKTADAYTAAKTASDEAQKRNPNNPVYSLNEARTALAKPDVNDALSKIADAIKLKIDYIDAYVLRAQIRTSQGETDATKDELNKYIAISPYDEQGYSLLGQADVISKDYAGALVAFGQARSVNPNNPNNYLNYINTLIIMGNKDQAITELKAFKALFPSVTGVDDEITKLQNGINTPVPPTTDTKTKK